MEFEINAEITWARYFLIRIKLVNSKGTILDVRSNRSAVRCLVHTTYLTDRQKEAICLNLILSTYQDSKSLINLNNKHGLFSTTYKAVYFFTYLL